MTRSMVPRMWIVAAWAAACLVASRAPAGEFVVNPKAPAAGDGNPGTAERPLKTVAKALEIAKAGDTILLATGEYPAVAIDKTYEKPLTLGAAQGARPVMTGGVSITQGRGVRLSGLTFTWPAGGRPSTAMTPFIRIVGSKDVEVAGCEIFDDPNLHQWVGWVCSVADSERVTVRDSNAHHFYFGFSAYRSKDVTFRNLDIRMWSHEDGIRTTECEGPILIEGCYLTNTGKTGAKGGHVDGIQVVHWTDNLTIRNCHLHGMMQGIGAFSSRGRRRKNWRVEGCLIYDVYAPHACSVYDCDGVTLVNNTLPQNRPFLPGCTGAVVRNNIFGLGGSAKDLGQCDYNLWMTGAKIGEHDLAGVDPKFVNAPLLVLRADGARLKDMTRSKFLFRESLRGRIAVGDVLEVMVLDGSARDAKPRKVTAVADNSLEVDSPVASGPDPGVLVFKWSADSKSLVPDYRLRADSPAIDSADGSVKRSPDRNGHEATDAPGVANAGAGDVKHLDRGAFEYVPGK